MPQVGDVLAGKYRLDARLGSGGMGVVYAATHVALAQSVAVKLLRTDSGEERGIATSRLMREARALAMLKSDHVARVQDVGVLDDGAPFLVMELLTGTTLDRVVAARGPLPIGDVAEIAIQICHALGEAHAHGIVHRDVKASNLFLTTDASGATRVKVIDFGISRARALTGDAAADTQSGALIGSPPYMSPEQIHAAKNVDARTDIWSLGVVLYHAASGRLPFQGESLLDLMTVIAFEEPAPLSSLRADVPEAFAAIVRRCMSKEREARYPSASALAAALAPFASERARALAASVVRGDAHAPASDVTADATRAPQGVTAAVDERTATALATSALGPSRARTRWPIVAGAIAAAAVVATLLVVARFAVRSAPAPASRDPVDVAAMQTPTSPPGPTAPAPPTATPTATPTPTSRSTATSNAAAPARARTRTSPRARPEASPAPPPSTAATRPELPTTPD